MAYHGRIEGCRRAKEYPRASAVSLAGGIAASY